jgi:hypothetical protein
MVSFAKELFRRGGGDETIGAGSKYLQFEIDSSD